MKSDRIEDIENSIKFEELGKIKMKNDKRIKEMVKKLPEIIMMYLSQSNPNHNNQIPPNVKTIEIKGSISKIFLSIIGVEVK